MFYKLLLLPKKILRYLSYKFYSKYNRLILNNLANEGGVIIGHNPKIYDSIFINICRGSSVKIGDNFIFTSGAGYNPLARNIKGEIYVRSNGSLSIGDNVGISSSCLWVNKHVSIGNNVKIGADCLILDTDAHNLDYRIRNGSIRNEKNEIIDSLTAKSGDIVIEEDVLVGTRCIILKNVSIGARSIIAAGSVVTKSIPSDCIAGGNPCKVLRRINTD